MMEIFSFYASEDHDNWLFWIVFTSSKSLQSCPTLRDPIDGSPPGFPIPRILQARKLEWVAISFSGAWKWKVKVKSLSRVRLSDPMDCSLSGSSVHGIFQARVLEWGAIAFSDSLHRALLKCRLVNNREIAVLKSDVSSEDYRTGRQPWNLSRKKWV